MSGFVIYYPSTVFCIIITVQTIPCIWGCGPVQQGRGIREILDDLNQVTSVRNYATNNLGTGEKPNESVHRQLFGRTFSINYHLSYSGTEEYLTPGNLSVVWKHNGETQISAKTQERPWCKNDSSNMFGLCITSSVDLTIYNVSRATSGKHQITLINENGESLSTTSTLRVKYKPRDVFRPVMDNVTGVTGDLLELQCSVETDINKESEIHHRFIWRHRNDVLHAPENHPIRELVKYTGSEYSVYSRQMSELVWKSTLTIQSVSHSRAGRYECWFKPDINEEEWLVQTAYVRVG